MRLREMKERRGSRGIIEEGIMGGNYSSENSL
jgi:hypothetical protein